MSADHEAEAMSFNPGGRPTVALASPDRMSAMDWDSSSTSVLGLANPEVGSAATLTALPNGLRKEVFGFLPYWMLDAGDLQWMQYQLVSTIAYFGVAARSDGTLATTSTGWNGWNSAAMTGVINAAHARGVKVVLVVTMMAWDGGAQQGALLGNATARARLISAIVSAVRNRNADGVNLDFEPVAVAQRAQYTSFVRQLKAALVSAGVGSDLTVCTMAGAATWATGYDLAGLVAPGAADRLFVMGYDYSWSGSARAGGVAPIESPYILDVNESVADYVRSVPANKIIWGVPYYGRTWLTQSNALNALTKPGASGASVAYYYTGNKALAARYGRLWDGVGRVPWFRYYDSGAASWVEGYYDDTVSLGLKWDMVNQRGLAGTGMWTLLMDAGSQDLWNLIANKFVNDTAAPTGGITSLSPITDASAIPVSWRAVDVGTGVLSYSVQVRDRAGGSWVSWLTNTTATSAYWLGQAGHAYEFRMSAIDRKGNRQPWVGSPGDPRGTLVVGGFAEVLTDTLNVRAGAGTTFGVQRTLAEGDRVFLMGGPIASGGYNWYQVQYDFTEWPSADYPLVGWAAAGLADSPYLGPAVAPAVTTMRPSVAGVATAPRRFSPNGDTVLDGFSVSFTLAAAATAAELDILDAVGVVVDTVAVGSLAAGAHTVAWDGRLASGAWAPAGAYAPRMTVTDASGVHVGPSAGVDATILATWGATADLIAPTVAKRMPDGLDWAVDAAVVVTFSEAVDGVDDASIALTDLTAGGASVPGIVAYDPTFHRLSFVPTATLPAGHVFNIRVGGGVRDLAGSQLAPISWTFATTTASDQTAYDPPVSLTFGPGTHTAFRFDEYGYLLDVRVVSLARASSAPTDQRSTRLPTAAGAWFKVTAGSLAGYWVPESPIAYRPGISAMTRLSPLPRIIFQAGTQVGYQFDGAGRVIASRSSIVTRPSTAAAVAVAVINGREHIQVADGALAGMWVRVSPLAALEASQTDVRAPVILSVTPKNTATGVATTSVISARFSEGVTGVDATSLVLQDAATGALIPATVTFVSGAATATLVPAGVLAPDRTYRVTATSAIHDGAGHALLLTTWTFKTAP
jgi:spore germination protein YaaH